MKLSDVVQGTQGELKNQVELEFKSVTTDSRKDVQGQIFFALKGDLHDGHRYIPDVVAKKVGCIVSHEWSESFAALCPQVSWVQVTDTLIALQQFSNYWRKKWGKKILAVTGSNGKTSVKDFTHTLLSGSFRALKNEGSFNNHWGLPLTLLNLRDEHDIAIIEMGMNHSGEIAHLCTIAEPNAAVVTNVGRAHIEHFGSIEGIAKAKEEIYQGLSVSGTAIFNLADSHTQAMAERWRSRFSKTFTFGTPSADIYFELVAQDIGGLRLRARVLKTQKEILAPLWGEQNVSNLMAAAGLALAGGVSESIILQQLEKCKTGWGRNHWVQLRSGDSVLFDGYNANPDSFGALLENLNRSVPPGTAAIGVFSEMLEQGTAAGPAHFELGKQVAGSVMDNVFFIGPSAAEFERGFKSLKTKKNLTILHAYEQSLALKIKSMLNTKSLVVIKGSRGGALERIVVQLDPLDFSTK